MSAVLQKRLYAAVYRIRRAEEEIMRIYPSDKIRSPVHLSIGQEAVSVGVCETLQPNDVVFGTYRGHALYLAKGGSMRGLFAELYGKHNGCARGKGGSMHLVDVSSGMMGTSAVVGTTISNAVGYAYAIKLKREPRVVVSFFGDGGTEEGAFWESINFASLKKLPILFVCENNRYAIHAPQHTRQPNDDLVGRVKSFGLKAQRVEDSLMAVLEHATAAVSSLRSPQSSQITPVFLECMTYRWREHVGPNDDFHLGYRTKEEADCFVMKDAVAQLAAQLNDADKREVQQKVENEIADAIAFAEKDAWPAPAELHSDLFRGNS
jgi:TPP-dependent pyruvate/acetoin dehydrogenase alpha subunit